MNEGQVPKEMNKQKIIPFYNPKIFNDSFFSFFSFHMNSIILNFNQQISQEDFFYCLNNSKEFKTKIDELKRNIYDVKRREQKKKNDQSTLNIIIDGFNNIEKSPLNKEDQKIIYVQYFFSLWEVISENTKQILKEYDQEKIMKYVYEYSTGQTNETILKYYWYYLYTNKFTQCKKLKIDSIIFIYDFFLFQCLYTDNDDLYEKKSEMIIYFFPFIETCLCLYKELPTKYIVCLYIIESYIDGIVIHLISFFTKLSKTVKSNHLSNIWQLILQVLLPYLSCYVDVLPQNTYLINKILLCIGGMRSYYGSIRKIMELIKLEKVKFTVQENQVLRNKTKSLNDITDEQELFFATILDWKMFPENLVYAYKEYVGKAKNYITYFINLLRFFSDDDQTNTLQQRELWCKQTTIFQNYNLYSHEALQFLNIKDNKKTLNLNAFLEKINYTQLCSFLLEPQLIEIDKTSFINSLRWIIYCPFETQFQAAADKISFVNIWNTYSGIILICSSILYPLPGERNEEMLIYRKSYTFIFLKHFCSIMKERKKSSVIPILEILAYISLIINSENSKEEMDLIIEILTFFVNNYFVDFEHKTKLFIFLEICFRKLYHLYIKGIMPIPHSYVLPLINMLKVLIDSNSFQIENTAILLCYLGMNFGCEAFKAANYFCIKNFLISKTNKLKNFTCISIIIQKWKEMIFNYKDIPKQQFQMLELSLNDNLINILNFLCHSEQEKDYYKIFLQTIFDELSDLLCGLILASTSTDNSKRGFIYEDLINKIFSFNFKGTVESTEPQTNENLHNDNNNNLSVGDMYNQFQLKIIKNLLIKLNDFEHVDKMKYLINILFHNHDIPNKDVDFSWMTSEILQYMYLDINNKIYFDYCKTNSHMKNQCLYGNSTLANKPPENAVILNTNHILISLIRGIPVKKYKLQKLKFLSKSLRRVYLVNENAITEYFNIINRRDIFKGLIKKEGVAQVIMEIFETLTIFIKIEGTLCISSKSLNEIEKKATGIYFSKSKDKTTLKMKYFNLIKKFILDICNDQNKQINQESLLVPSYVEDSIPYFFGTMAYYFNTLLIDKKINYNICRNTLQCKQGSTIQTDLEEYIDFLCLFYLSNIKVDLTLPVLYILFIIKELIVAFNYEDIFKCFWLCFLIRWPKYGNNTLKLWKIRYASKFSKEIMVNNIQTKQIDNKDIPLIHYLSEYLCFYFLQYLHDERLYNVQKDETKIYKEILDLFGFEKDKKLEAEEMLFLDGCQGCLFYNQKLTQLYFRNEEKDLILKNLDNSMLFSSETQIIIVNNEKINDSKTNIEKNRLQLFVMSSSYNNSFYIEDYIENNSTNNKNWQNGVKQLLFDLSNLNTYPFQIFKHITPIDNAHTSILSELFSEQELFTFDVPVLIVPFTNNILSKYNIFSSNVNNNQNLYPFIKFLSYLGEITQATNDSFIVTSKKDLYSINFNVISKNPSLSSQIEFEKKHNIHILYTENPNQPQGTFKGFYDEEFLSEETTHVFFIIKHIAGDFFSMKRKWNCLSQMEEIFDRILPNNSVINLENYSGIRYFINSIILCNEMIRFKNKYNTESVFSKRINLIQKIVEIGEKENNDQVN